MKKQKKDQYPEWSLWFLIWLIFFGLIILYLTMPPVGLNFFSAKLSKGDASLEVYGESDNDIVIMSIIIGFFGSIILTIISWTILKIYKIKNLEKKRKRPKKAKKKK